MPNNSAPYHISEVGKDLDGSPVFYLRYTVDVKGRQISETKLTGSLFVLVQKLIHAHVEATLLIDRTNKKIASQQVELEQLRAKVQSQQQ